MIGSNIRRWIMRKINYIRFGNVTERVVGTVGHNVPSEIEFIDKHGNVVGFWAYGHWHPDSKYKD